MKRKWKLLLLAVLGFSAACDDDHQVCMYGTPHIDARVGGRVVDASGTPIPGIEVGHVEHPEIPTIPLAKTDADGRYEFEISTFPKPIDIRFTDVDGEANGGDFATQDLRVEFSEEDRVGRRTDAWYLGAYARSGVDVALSLKEPETTPEEE